MAQKYPVPDYYRTVMPYLILADADDFLAFAEKVFRAEIKMNIRDENDEMQHAEIVIGDSTIMIGQSSGPWKPQPAGLYVMVENAGFARSVISLYPATPDQMTIQMIREVITCSRRGYGA